MGSSRHIILAKFFSSNVGSIQELHFQIDNLEISCMHCQVPTALNYECDGLHLHIFIGEHFPLENHMIFIVKMPNNNH